MEARRLESTDSGYVHLQLAKGVLLLLPIDDYIAALKRGKAYRRAIRRAARLEALAAQREAAALDWIEKET